MKLIDSLSGRLKIKPFDRNESDEASIESSSVYTTSIKKGCKLIPVAESEMEDKSGSDDDEISRGSTIDTRRSIHSRFLHFKRTQTRNKLHSGDDESFLGSFADYEDYDFADIERQMQDINVSKLEAKNDAEPKQKQFGNDPLEQAPTPSYTSSRNQKDTEKDGMSGFSCVSKESAKRYKLTVILVFASCLFFLLSASLIVTSFRKKSSATAPTTSPIVENSTALLKDDPAVEECIDDMTGVFYVGTELQDCSYLASNPSSQTLFCSPAYDEVYELCKKTCKKCY